MPACNRPGARCLHRVATQAAGTGGTAMTHTTIKHLAMAALFTALTMLAVAPASAQPSSTGHGWERTGNATGQPQSGGGQASQPTTTVEGPRGWERTAVAGGGTTGVAVADSDDSPVSSPST